MLLFFRLHVNHNFPVFTLFSNLPFTKKYSRDTIEIIAVFQDKPYSENMIILKEEDNNNDDQRKSIDASRRMERKT